MDDPSCLPQPAQGKHQEREFRQCNRCPVCPPHLVRRPRGAKGLHLKRTKGSPNRYGLKLVIREEVLPMKDQPEFPALALLASRGLLAPDAWKCKRAQVSLKVTIDVPMLVQSSNKMVMGFWKIPTCQWDGHYTSSGNVVLLREYDMKEIQ